MLSLIQPFGVRLCIGEVCLQLLIFNNAALFEIDQQHFARLQAPFANDVLFLEGQNAAFRRHADDIILGDAIARRAQTIAIQRCANLAAIGKGDRRRAVPRLHQGGVIFVKGTARRVHLLVLRPSLWDQHHHCMGKAETAGEQQLKRIVETGRVGLAMRDQRPHLIEVSAEQIRFHRAAARIHPVHIAANRVDLAIVRDQTIGVGQPPAGEGVGREALVHQTHGGLALRIAQIIVKRTNLVREE